VTPSNPGLNRDDNEETADNGKLVGPKSRCEGEDGTALDDSTAPAPTRKGRKRGHQNEEPKEPASRQGGDETACNDSTVPPTRKGPKWGHQNEEPAAATSPPAKRAKPKAVRSF
jgi:hypothetical protein